MRIFVVYLNAGWSGWDHHVIALSEDDDMIGVVDTLEELAAVKAKQKTKLDLTRVMKTEVIEITAENNHMIIRGGP